MVDLSSKYLSPRPWHVARDSVHDYWTDSCSIMAADGSIVCALTRGRQAELVDDPDGEPGEKYMEGCPSWDNADLIVEAVNSYNQRT